jgi:hypothetical protein
MRTPARKFFRPPTPPCSDGHAALHEEPLYWRAAHPSKRIHQRYSKCAAFLIFSKPQVDLAVFPK